MKKALTLFLICLTFLANAQSGWNMNLLGTYDYPTTEGNDIWGWVDDNNNEYALVGLRSGFSVVNVTNPSSPSEEFFISDVNSTWRDIKTWGNYAYVTTEEKQNLKVRIVNIIGEELINEDLQQFIGEYTKKIDLTNNAKGIYFLEIETDNGIINKKLILQ